MTKKISKKVIVIVGSTASGKTGIGVKLAKEFNGEIISADSRQVYRGLDLGTGKEGSRQSRQISNIKYQITNNKLEHLRQNLRYIDAVPQWMIDICEPEEKFSLFDYLPLAREAIKDILSRSKLPIVVGGTGLYVQGLVEGFELKPTVISTPREARVEKSLVGRSLGKLEMTKHSREQLDNLTVQQLNNILKDIDPDKYEKVDKKNKHRLIRAIELAEEGLTPIKIKPPFEFLQIGIDKPRKELYERIDQRVDERFEQGMLEEVEGLLERGVDPEWLKGLGLEYREITNFIIYNDKFLIPNKKLNSKFQILNTEFEAMSQQLKFKIHQFARRQLTWLRRFPEINWLLDYDEIKRFAKIFLMH